MAYAETNRRRQADQWVRKIESETGKQVTLWQLEPRGYRVQCNELGSEYLSHLLKLGDHAKVCGYCQGS